ncbi:DUF4199 domain-containing protein [Formosa sp. S-31]|uniref:DUF4199 domain-containing protein n=1 Tax=Formosa sp. S-31 TaxID=2790949 RepID=UPI003EBF7702
MKSSVKVAVRYGIYTTIALIIYFLALRTIDFHTNPWFRVLNGIVVTFGIFSAIRDYKEEFYDEFTYVNGFKVGLITGFFSTLLFSFFMAIYLFHLDPGFKDMLLRDWFHNVNQGGGILIFILILEGFSSSVVITLANMQYFKKSTKILQNT